MQRTSVDTQERQTTNEWVSSDLKCQSGKWLVVTGSQFNLFTIFISCFEWLNIQWRWQVVDNSVQHHLDTLILVGRTCQNWEQLFRQSSLTDSSFDFFNRKFFTAKVLFHDVVINVSQRFQQCIVTRFSFVLQVSRDFNSIPVLTFSIFIINVGNHLNQVDNTDEVIFSTNWHLNWQWRNVQTVLDRLNRVVKVGTHLVHLVGKDDSRNIEVVSLTPNSFGLWFNTGLSVQNRYGTIKDTQRTFNFDSEVNVTWGVDDVDTVVFPNGRSGSGRDRDTTFLFFIHPVHLGSTIMGFTNLVNLTSVVKNPFSGRGLTSIDVGHDPNVTGLFKRVFTFVSHLKSFLLPVKKINLN